MDAYIYQAALLCEDCAKATIKTLTKRNCTDTGDSDDWPQGPYSEGGGEADCPQHCDHCNVFLENPLTTDGVEYVKEQVRNSLKLDPIPHFVSPVVAEWHDFYGYADFSVYLGIDS